MGLKFTKMHGLGNDFIVIDAINQSVHLTADHIRTLSHRHTGIGFDQCLLVEESSNPNIDFFYRIFNADGSMVGQCGNGARCLARFIQHYGLSQKSSLSVATTTTTLTLTINPDDSVTVDMGVPRFGENVAIPEKNIALHTVNLGNPHAVLIVDDIEAAPVETLGPYIETHALFPEKTNVGFLELLAPNQVKLRVHERGAGETNACGSGAAAAAAVARKFYGLDEHTEVTVLGGKLCFDWARPNSPLFMTGPASFVFEGELLS